jgi:hypothetical protein
VGLGDRLHESAYKSRDETADEAEEEEGIKGIRRTGYE